MPMPNIVMILTDDQGYWAMGCAANPEIHTPNLDRLAAAGMRFNQFFCVSPVCSPARASILTGRIPSQHGVHDWLRAGNSSVEKDGYGTEQIEYLKGEIGYTDILARNGYTCGLSGKWHLGAAAKGQQGFTYWQTHAKGGGPYYGAPMIKDGKVYTEERYVTDVITDNALRFIDERANLSAPFYLGVHYTAPHSPWDRTQHPAEIYERYFNDCSFESIPDVPMHPWQSNTAPAGTTPERRREILSGYFAAVTAMDAQLGRILELLDDLGIRKDTLILFTSDNGMNMGHHGIYGKGNGTFPLNMFDTSVKVPAIISRPGHVPEGVVCENMLSHYDIMPTLLDYVGMDAPETASLPGRSFAPLLSGGEYTEREDVVVYDEYGPVRMIRTREWKYVHRYPYGPHELFDLVSDPDEECNLIDKPEHRDRIVGLRERLDTWFAAYVDPAVDGTREGVTGKGQICLAGIHARGKDAYKQDITHLGGRIPGFGRQEEA